MGSLVFKAQTIMCFGISIEVVYVRILGELLLIRHFDSYIVDPVHKPYLKMQTARTSWEPLKTVTLLEQEYAIIPTV